MRSNKMRSNTCVCHLHDVVCAIHHPELMSEKIVVQWAGTNSVHVHVLSSVRLALSVARHVLRVGYIVDTDGGTTRVQATRVGLRDVETGSVANVELDRASGALTLWAV